MARKKNAEAATAVREMKPITARTENQQKYLDAITQNDILFVTGPPGSGKTTCAMGAAAHALYTKKIERIMLTHPARTGGKDLGLLPGSVIGKMKHFVAPMFDELVPFLGKEVVKTLIATGSDEASELIDPPRIAVVPPQYFPGRTFKHTWVVMDEAQNATFDELHMLITRIGVGSKIFLLGDPDQSVFTRCALPEIMQVLDSVEGICAVRLDATDIVRHPVIAQIEERIKAYNLEM